MAASLEQSAGIAAVWALGVLYWVVSDELGTAGDRMGLLELFQVHRLGLASPVELNGFWKTLFWRCGGRVLAGCVGCSFWHV